MSVGSRRQSMAPAVGRTHYNVRTSTLHRELRAGGWACERNDGTHQKWCHPSGRTVSFATRGNEVDAKGVRVVRGAIASIPTEPVLVARVDVDEAAPIDVPNPVATIYALCQWGRIPGEAPCIRKAKLFNGQVCMPHWQEARRRGLSFHFQEAPMAKLVTVPEAASAIDANQHPNEIKLYNAIRAGTLKIRDTRSVVHRGNPTSQRVNLVDLDEARGIMASVLERRRKMAERKAQAPDTHTNGVDEMAKDGRPDKQVRMQGSPADAVPGLRRRGVARSTVKRTGAQPIPPKAAEPTDLVTVPVAALNWDPRYKQSTSTLIRNKVYRGEIRRYGPAGVGMMVSMAEVKAAIGDLDGRRDDLARRGISRAGVNSKERNKPGPALKIKEPIYLRREDTGFVYVEWPYQGKRYRRSTKQTDMAAAKAAGPAIMREVEADVDWQARKDAPPPEPEPTTRDVLEGGTAKTARTVAATADGLSPPAPEPTGAVVVVATPKAKGFSDHILAAIDQEIASGNVDAVEWTQAEIDGLRKDRAQVPAMERMRSLLAEVYLLMPDLGWGGLAINDNGDVTPLPLTFKLS